VVISSGTSGTGMSKNHFNMNYFSSDWHLGHTNVIRYDNRPFKTVEEMDNNIIGNATHLLKEGDNLYYLGDFALTRSKNAMEGYIKAIAWTGANLFFIKGNHDKKDTIRLYERYGTYLGEQKKIKISDEDAKDGLQEIVLNHYSMRVWDKSHHGAWHLYGHSHDGLDKHPNQPWGKSMDCSVVSANRLIGDYTLFSYPQIEAIMKKRAVKIIDHHGKTDRE
jgi:calcineurin-like phosphoesterase family protein